MTLLLLLFVAWRLTTPSPFWNIPGPEPKSFLLGNLGELLQKPVGLAEFEWQKTYGDVVRFGAALGTDQLMIADPKALQHILQSSGYGWRKSPVRREMARLTSGKGLAWADGDVHTRQRKIMLPGFRAPETKFFVPFFISSAEAMCSVWKAAIAKSGSQSDVFNFPDYISRATLDAIGQSEEPLLSRKNFDFWRTRDYHTICWAMYELARQPKLQAKLRNEIQAMEETIADRGNSDFTLQDFEEMPLLVAMSKETLRYYPVAIHLYRTASEDDRLPLSKPIVGKSGKIITEIPIPKGTQVIGSIQAYNRNKDIFGEDSFEFNPNRWIEGRVQTDTPLGVYANLATFASGMRSCLGWRFTVAELQAFIVVLLRNFQLESTPKLAGIRRESALTMVPTIEGELDKGSQLPLKVTLLPNNL
ncbi:hypothetical protein GYMLUDRAFT_244040 [Collybiopsis luxurians FD-317 M1]|uniref:Cytochrome P450 n=1 Tax=Collybiopsis luxurians FD-317 M1 TaxID=944289 RepID=A0A0D0CPR6_9AGAR|nr:hypothetical protein GYMLUDRAFT_244040 [Collybiopsis luxurians FD-317 M1]